MEQIVDLHIHSHFSRATSKSCNFEGLYFWGKIKGIHIIGTGDFTHPEWFVEMREMLEPAEPGLYRLREDIAAKVDALLPESVRDNPIRFVPSVEISTIYSKGGKVRKLHQLLIAPDFKTVSAINAQLERIGNLKADGRPILGLDSKELLRITTQTNPDALFIPAHIWTPWFGMFGSKSGFDSIEEAYEELTPHITTIETGLSSDPHMNWRVGNLHNVAVTSNSDAHSPQKLGREATIVRAKMSYSDIIGALKTNDERLIGTIEFFPEEGKYHADGHRACNVRLEPSRTRELEGVCPVCGKALVIGVNHRVDSLADYPHGHTLAQPKTVEYIIPLAEIIAELKGTKTTTSKTVVAEYDAVIQHLGDEFSVLRTVSLETIRDAGFPLLALAIERLRTGNVVREPGFDGVYGTIKVFKDMQERQQTLNQLALL